VSLPSHDEAVARLVYSIDTVARRIMFTAEAGLGKTRVLRKALEESAHSRRRIVVIQSPQDEEDLVSQMAVRLGVRIGAQASLSQSWRALERAVRVTSLEGFQLVMAVDDWDGVALARGLDHLAGLGSERGISLTVIQVARPSVQTDPVLGDSWPLAIRLRRLTRSQVESYLAAKLDAAGCTERIFTPRAATRLHAVCGGVPRGIDRLASLSLIAGAVRGLEVISPDVIDGVAWECWAGDSDLHGDGAWTRPGVASHSG
jgi:type II secretory pathway predicted ATPase ExeA